MKNGLNVDKNGNIRIPYMGGEVLFRNAGKFVTDDGKEVDLTEAIKVTRGAFSTVMPFEAFAAIVEAAYLYPEVHEFLKNNGVNLKMGLL